MKRLLLGLLLGGAPWMAQAGTADVDFGRYLAKYPGMYASAALVHEPRDEIFDAKGDRVGSSVPTYGPDNAFPQTTGRVRLEWHFPFFETEAIPFVSARLWTARAQMGYARGDTEGAIAGAARARGGEPYSDGLTDLELDFGPVLYGSRNWREREATPLSVLLLAGLRIPVGERNADAPNNVGANTFAWRLTLGAHARPAPHWLVDAGLRWQGYAVNQEPAFGAQEPARQGADLAADVTLARRLVPDWYLSASLYARRGDANAYSDVRFAANEPQPDLLMETFPSRDTQHDGGTRELKLDLGAHWFATQRVLVALRWQHPLAGESGEFDLPYLQQLQDCEALPLLGCDPQPNGAAHVDGLGAARVYASDVVWLSASWNFGQGDPWLWVVR